jgi:hypothetical protein
MTDPFLAAHRTAKSFPECRRPPRRRNASVTAASARKLLADQPAWLQPCGPGALVTSRPPGLKGFGRTTRSTSRAKGPTEPQSGSARELCENPSFARILQRAGHPSRNPHTSSDGGLTYPDYIRLGSTFSSSRLGPSITAVWSTTYAAVLRPALVAFRE